MPTAITPFGALHTAISLIAVAAGIVALVRYRGISLRTRSGQWYVVGTVLTCLTGFFIFHHGGFGPPHVLGILTLLALAAGAVAEKSGLLGRASAYIETVAYTTTFFFHMVPAFTETGTRLPQATPLFTSADDPALQKAIGVAFALFLIGLAAQLWRLRQQRRAEPGVTVFRKAV